MSSERELTFQVFSDETEGELVAEFRIPGEEGYSMSVEVFDAEENSTGVELDRWDALNLLAFLQGNL